ncbi:MAG: valine--tRNA ligase [Polyangiaceae bacterium]|nr:valine--tRNA ligase [Polyangiaceae bacterium]
MTELAKAYEPKPIEAHWEKRWIELGVFAASDDPNDPRPRYVLPMPPPNVTGSLHMGHALFCTLEDILTRYHRMAGFCTLWQPGIDHAGIATQTVVERQLKREGISRHDLGREKFLERVWKWKAESGGRIAEQQRALGVSADWDRSKFTMDPDLSRSVREAFYRLYQEKLIYRDTRLVHWDCEAQTVLSNLEVENEPAQGELFMFAYKVSGTTGDDPQNELVIATTRPETMLGDTAVAVHPDDPRYKHLHGKFLDHPFVNRKIPIITDAELVDMTFGTGAVKVTPAHDWNDFATGKRHKLEEINILTLDGKMNENGGQFAGMDRFVARKAVKKALDEKGLARGSKPHELMLPRSERSGSIVEPMISTQWFVKMKPLADPALEAVRKGETVIIPEEWAKTYDHFLSNILDWCISRQLWWGHRIPAYYCDKCNHITVTREEKLEACEACGNKELRQDEDVLDTWFSSALWPFSTLGWPEETNLLKKFYPASDLETGYDILFFWVARMMMMGIHFMGAPPFKRILLHGLVVDETGDKMSKVKGNVIDPLDLIYGASFDEVVQKALPGAPIEEALKKFKKAYPSAAQMGSGFPAYGTDAMRFTLASYSPQAKRIPLSPKKIEGYRHFCNKLWNATRFALPYLDGAKIGNEPPKATHLGTRWILSRLAATIETVQKGIDEFRLDDSTQAAYRFVWNELCDWYLELSKPVFAGTDEAAKTEWRTVLAYVLEASLRLLHPFIPFITEELWHKVPRPDGSGASLSIAPYPNEKSGRRDEEAEREMAILQAVISQARSMRTEHQIKPALQVDLRLRSSVDQRRALLERERVAIEVLAKTSAGFPRILAGAAGGDEGTIVAGIDGDTRYQSRDYVEDVEVFLPIEDIDKELERLDRTIKGDEKDVVALEKKLALPSFKDKAPKEVVEQTLEELGAKQRRLAANRQSLELLKKKKS